MARIHSPEHLHGATDFSHDGVVNDPLWVIRTLKQTAWVWRDLERATTMTKRLGRKRDHGKKWALAFLLFVVSDSVDVQPWWESSSAEAWRECGFAAKPAYQTVWERFVELEQHGQEAFLQAAGAVIRHSRRHEPRIGRHIHVDSTEAETHAALVHDCRPGEGCPWEGKPRWKRAGATRPERVDTSRVRDDRHSSGDAPLADEDAPDLGGADRLVRLIDTDSLRVKVGKHWYRSRDTSAGVRAYTGPKGGFRFWHGFYNVKFIDHVTGAPLSVGVATATRREHQLYPIFWEELLETVMGRDWRCEAVVADRGFSIASVFEFNTRRGIASVINWRASNWTGSKRHDKLGWDRHGVPRCKHCGGDSRFVRFAERPSPRIWFGCAVAATPACQKTQSIACSKDWRLLVPLWRTDQRYYELRTSHKRYERVQRHWRDRYHVGGEHVATRPKRIGAGWQQLRANGALLAEWLRISYREGWLGSARRNTATAVRYTHKAAKALGKLITARHKAGLSRPYGPQAAKLGLGDADPPSRRAGP
jgi:hypothetical protein